MRIMLPKEMGRPYGFVGQLIPQNHEIFMDGCFMIT